MLLRKVFEILQICRPELWARARKFLSIFLALSHSVCVCAVRSVCVCVHHVCVVPTFFCAFTHKIRTALKARKILCRVQLHKTLQNQKTFLFVDLKQLQYVH